MNGVIAAAGNYKINSVIPGTIDMSLFGSIVSGWQMSGISEVNQGDPIMDWEDSYGTNDGTKNLKSVAYLDITAKGREVFVDYQAGGKYGGFNFSEPSNLDFNPLTDDFSIVLYTGNTMEAGSPLLGWSGYTYPNINDTKYSMFYKLDNNLEVNIGNSSTTIATDVANYKIVTISYTSSNTTLLTYVDGILIQTNVISPVNVTTASRGFDIGQLNGGATNSMGHFLGVWIYNEALGQTAITNIQNHLNP